MDGTRITVHRIATLANQGHSAADIAATYEHLDLSQVHAALAYYYANQPQIDEELADDDAEFDIRARLNG